MKILAGKGESVQLVEFYNTSFGVGIVYDDGSFNGQYFDNLESATEIYDLCQSAIANYFAKFGTASE